MWQVADSDTTVYLFGTIHLLPNDYAWRTAAFDKAVAGSQGLIVETIVDPPIPRRWPANWRGSAFARPAADRRAGPARKARRLDAAIAKTGIPEAPSTGWKPGRRRSCCSAPSSRTLA